MGQETVFDIACQQFLESLSERDRARYRRDTSYGDVLKGLESLEALSKKHQSHRLNRTLRVLETWNTRLKPFFSLVEGAVANGKLYGGVILGGVRLVLELASWLPSFFDKLLTIIETICDTFPQYAAIDDICRDVSSTRLVTHLGNVFKDLLGFIQDASKVFTSGKGALRRPAEVIAAVAWKPFDQRFETFVRKLGTHRELLLDELQIMQMKAALDSRSKIDDVLATLTANQDRLCEVLDELQSLSRDQLSDRISAFIKAPTYASTLESLVSACEDDTAQWIYAQPKFQSWLGHDVLSGQMVDFSEKIRLLWIYGNPGAGKSTLAASMVNFLRSRRRPTATRFREILYFFFRERDGLRSSSPASAYRSILAQLLHRRMRDEHLLDRLSVMMREAPGSDGQSTATEGELVDLLQLCLEDLGSSGIILDGVDECTDTESLMNTIKVLIKLPKVNILVLSRSTVYPLARLVPESQRLNFGQQGVEDDIRLYVSRNLNLMMEDGLFDHRTDISHLIDHLVIGADRMFIWAKLMIRLLRSPAQTPSGRERLIRSITMPEGLESLYNRIFTLIAQSPEVQRRLARDLLIWVIFGFGPLTGRDLQMAVGHQDYQTGTFGAFERFLDIVPIVTEGLISIHCPVEEVYCCRPVHVSLVEYLERWKPSPGPIISEDTIRPSRFTAHLELACASLKELIRAAPAQRLTKQSSQTIRHLPLTQYAALKWPLHMEQSVTPTGGIWDRDCYIRLLEKLQETLAAFLSSPMAIATFIDSFYRRDLLHSGELRLLPALKPIRQWTKWLPTSSFKADLPADLLTTISDLEMFYREMSSFADSWEAKLCKNPGLVWDDALVFPTTRFLPRNESSTMMQFYPQRDQLNTTCSSKPLCHISATSEDGCILGTLSIWTSAHYEGAWASLQTETAFSQIELFCSGWTARYELFSLDNQGRKMKEVCIPLDACEVALQMRQAFRQEHEQGWTTSFHLTISPNGYGIIVLRTYYRLHKNSLGSTPTWDTMVLPLNEVDSVRDKWTKDLRRFDPTSTVLRDRPPRLQMVSRDWYSYSTFLTVKDDYLLFSDYQGHFRVELVLFKIPDTGSNIQVVSTAFWHGIRAESALKNITFHRNATIIAFTSGDRIYIWDFSQGQAGLSTVRHNNSSSPILGVSFSSCGSYLVASTQRGTSVISLEGSRSNLDHQSRPYFDPVHESEVGGMYRRVTKRTAASMESASTPNDSKRATIRSSNVQVSLSGGPNYQVGVTTKGLIRLTSQTLTGEGAASTQQAHLLELPANVGDLDAVVRLPLSNDAQQTISIVLNKPSEQGYHFGEATDEYFPAVICRDVASISQTPIHHTQHVDMGNRFERPKLMDPRAKKGGEADSADGLSNPGPLYLLEGTTYHHPDKSLRLRKPNEELL